MKKFSRKKLIVFAVIAIILGILLVWGNNALQITNYNYSSELIPENFDNFKIVQISDLHNKRFGKNAERLTRKIKKCKPDIIVITGDLIDSNHTNIDNALDAAEAFTEIAPTYFITGNHEKWLDDDDFDTLIKGIENLGITILDDSSVEIKKDDSSFTLCGLDDESLTDDTLNTLLKESSSDFKLLLAHEPQFFDDYSASDADLVLSGHAHGGQIRIPFTHIGIIAPDQYFLPEYSEGKFSKNDTTMIISRGLGNSIIPFRIFNRPEIVCISLHCK